MTAHRHAMATAPLLKRDGPAPLAGGNRADTQSRSDRDNRRLAGELQDLARAVRRIGCAFHSDPEAIALAKDTIARRLAALARAVECAR